MLHAAVVLADTGDAITGAAVATFGREELGRCGILRDLAEQVHAGRELTAKAAQKACDDYVAKQRKGASSTTLRANPSIGLHAVLQAIAEPGSDEWQSALPEADKATEAKHKKDPEERNAINGRALRRSGRGGCWLA